MRGRISERVERLEGHLSRHNGDDARIEEDARAFRDRITRMAANLSEADRSRGLEDRLAGSCANHLAWALRFDPEGSDPPAILRMHGVVPGGASHVA